MRSRNVTTAENDVEIPQQQLTSPIVVVYQLLPALWVGEGVQSSRHTSTGVNTVSAETGRHSL